MQLDFFCEHEDLVPDENGKVCSKCNEYLPLSSFSPCSGGNYLRAECRSCNTKIAVLRKKLKQAHMLRSPTLVTFNNTVIIKNHQN